MLDRLLESGVQRKKSAWGGTASVAVHGAIIALAVAATAQANPVAIRGPEAVPIIALQPPPDDRPTADTRRDGPRKAANHTPVPEIPTVDFKPTFDPTLPGTTPPVSAGVGIDATLLSEIGGATATPGAPLGGTGIATDASVDVPVRALADRAPAYPETLRAAGIAGSVRMQFVVDTIGRVELSSVRVLESSHDLFARSVLASLRQARFTPGEVSGRRVRTLVERSFRFDIAGGAR